NVFPVIYGRLAEGMGEDATIYDRYDLVFKWPRSDQGPLSISGKGTLDRSTVQRVLREKSSRGVYLAVFDPHALPLPEPSTLTAWGILQRLVACDHRADTGSLERVWRRYARESFYDSFERDYMARQVCAYFFFHLGKYAFSSGRPDQGLETLRLASRIGYDDELIHSDIGVFLSDLRLFEEAREELEKALVYHEDLSVVYGNWGYFYTALGDYDQAVLFLEKAIDLRPDKYGYYNNFGFALYQVGRKEEALAALRKSLSMFRDQPVIERFIREHAFHAESAE
ncbi:MAG: tetratricopeptide repeat protein, partial [Deltaproteobacteria bacterium]|nr:tetratricopeptide repeat protein [Deltaproteobacteria bacterium]